MAEETAQIGDSSEMSREDRKKASLKKRIASMTLKRKTKISQVSGSRLVLTRRCILIPACL